MFKNNNTVHCLCLRLKKNDIRWCICIVMSFFSANSNIYQHWSGSKETTMDPTNHPQILLTPSLPNPSSNNGFRFQLHRRHLSSLHLRQRSRRHIRPTPPPRRTLLSKAVFIGHSGEETISISVSISTTDENSPRQCPTRWCDKEAGGRAWENEGGAEAAQRKRQRNGGGAGNAQRRASQKHVQVGSGWGRSRREGRRRHADQDGEVWDQRRGEEQKGGGEKERGVTKLGSYSESGRKRPPFWKQKNEETETYYPSCWGFLFQEKIIFHHSSSQSSLCFSFLISIYACFRHAHVFLPFLFLSFLFVKIELVMYPRNTNTSHTKSHAIHFFFFGFVCDTDCKEFG